jgi:release factor glutamine methyltransferase
LRINADSLVPRPDSETVVGAALAAIEHLKPREWQIGDLGTGSGALLLALLAEVPGALGIGTDINPAALACARANGERLGLSGRARFAASDYGKALRGPFDLLVSNPPYIARGDIARLPPEVRDFDPWPALDGGADGLDGYRAIAGDARRLLMPEGLLVVELGFGQLTPVTSLFSAAGLAPAAVKHDLAGVPRALTLRPMP